MTLATATVKLKQLKVQERLTTQRATQQEPMLWRIIDIVKQLCGRTTSSKREGKEMSTRQKDRKGDKVLICVEGNISSGKSTTVNTLREAFQNDDRVKFLLEPLSIWEGIRDKDGNNMIKKFYGDIKRYAFAFQMMAYISRLDILREALSDPDVDVIVTERSLFTDRNVFAQMLHDDGMLEDVEHTIYLKWFDSFIRDIPETKVFYIRTTPDVAMQRLRSRNRDGENVSLEYLERVHKYHDNWLVGNPLTVVIDGNADISSEEQPSKTIEAAIRTELSSRMEDV